MQDIPSLSLSHVDALDCLPIDWILFRGSVLESENVRIARESLHIALWMSLLTVRVLGNANLDLASGTDGRTDGQTKQF